MTTKEPLRVQCPACKTAVIWNESSPHRPFCSTRCRNEDFIAWANEERRIPGDQDYDDILSGELDDPLSH